MQLALDSTILIHAVEGTEESSVAIACLQLVFEHVHTTPFIVSELLLAEVLTLQLREGNADLVRFYRRLLTDLHAMRMVPVNRSVLLEAARLRSVSALKLPDAIHLATATRAGCKAFVSLDRMIKAPGAVLVIPPDEAIKVLA